MEPLLKISLWILAAYILGVIVSYIILMLITWWKYKVSIKNLEKDIENFPGEYDLVKVMFKKDLKHDRDQLLYGSFFSWFTAIVTIGLLLSALVPIFWRKFITPFKNI